MKKILFLLIIPFLSFGQGWEQIYDISELNAEYQYNGNTWMLDGEQTNDGGYIILGYAGFTLPLPEEECGAPDWGFIHPIIIKTDSDGNEEWIKTFGEGEAIMYGSPLAPFTFADAASIIETNDGGYAFLSNKQEYTIDIDKCALDRTLYNSPLVKLFPNGYEEWSQTYALGVVEYDFNGNCSYFEYDNLHGVKQTLDNGYLISGILDFGCPPQQTRSSQIVKTDINGVEEWRQSFSVFTNSGGMFPMSIHALEVEDGYIVFETVCSGNNGNPDVNNPFNILKKINFDGEILWYYTLSNTGYFECPSSSIEKTSDGGFIVYGADLRKLNENGEEEWTQNFSTVVSRAAQTSDEGYILWIYTFDTDSYQLCKINSNGEEEWTQTYGDIASSLTKLEQTADGGYVIFTTKNTDSGRSMCIIKTNEWGNITSTIELPSINKNLITKIDILGRETTNKGFSIEIYDDGSVEKRYIIE